MTNEKLRINRIVRGLGKKKRTLPSDLIYAGSFLLLFVLLCVLFLRPAASETSVLGLNGSIGAGNQGLPSTSPPNPSSTTTPTTASTKGNLVISGLSWPIAGVGVDEIDEDGLFGTYRSHEDGTLHEGIDIIASKDASVD